MMMWTLAICAYIPSAERWIPTLCSDKGIGAQR